MIESLLAHPVATKLLKGASFELSGWFRDPVTGLKCRIRPDAVREDLSALPDLKTARDISPAGFAKAVWNHGYHIQLQFYAMGLQAIFAKKPRNLCFIAVENQEPFDCVVYACDEGMITRAEMEIQTGLARIKRGVETGNWAGAPARRSGNALAPGLHRLLGSSGGMMEQQEQTFESFEAQTGTAAVLNPAPVTTAKVELPPNPEAGRAVIEINPKESKKIAVQADETGVLIGKNFDEQYRIATAFAASRMLPPAWDTPEKVFFGIQMAHQLGLKPLLAMRQMVPINGNVSIWGDLPLAIVRSSGLLVSIKEYWYDEKGAPINWLETPNAVWAGAYCEVWRKGSGPKSFAYSIKDAKEAGLWGKKVWAVHPKRMAQLRARGWLLKDEFSDVLMGVSIAGVRPPRRSVSVGTRKGDQDRRRIRPQRRVQSLVIFPSTFPLRPASGRVETVGRRMRHPVLFGRPPRLTKTRSPMTEAEQVQTAAPSIESPNRVPRKVTKQFDFLLTDNELAERAREVAALDRKKTLLEVEFADVKTKYKGQLADLETSISQSFEVIRKGQETRTVDTDMIFDYNSAEVEYWVDGKKHEVRAMTVEERQKDLFIKGANPIEGRQQAEELQTASDDAPEDEEDTDGVVAGQHNPDGIAYEDLEKTAEITEIRAAESKKKSKRSSVDASH
jgi:hypothetical protein